MRAADTVRPWRSAVHALGVLVLAGVLGCRGGDALEHAPARAPDPARDVADVTWHEAASEVPARKVLWRVIDHDELPRNEEVSLEVRVLSGEAPIDVQRLDVKGWMPAHGHGFVQDPQVTELEAGVFRVDGLLLHMRGHWELRLQIFDSSGLDVVVIELDV